MNNSDTISDEQINAFIDNELDADDYARILRLSQSDVLLTQRIDERRNQKEMLAFAYKQKKSNTPFTDDDNSARTWKSLAAAVLVFVFGGVAGITGTMQIANNPSQSLIEKIALQEAAPEKMILQISSNDPARIKAALNDAELLLRQSKLKNQNIQLEVIANADGLNMLRIESPYQKTISSLSANHDNVRFLACGTGMSKFKQKGINLTLVPQAEVVSAVTTQVAMRLNQGWSYLRE